MRGNIWDNFSSQSYKDLPSVGGITWFHPVTGEPRQYAMPAGGRGYVRPPSLVSLWSTAPFLVNNSVGRFEASGSVDGRMRSFNDSIEKLLWPERREHDPTLGAKVPGMIDRTTAASFLRISSSHLPSALSSMVGKGERIAPFLWGQGEIEIGPIPAGTPVNLIANLKMLLENADPKESATYNAKILNLFTRLRDLKDAGKDATGSQARQILGNLIDSMLDLNACPDFVVNRGHYFGTAYVEPGGASEGEPALSDQDKRALIEFLKTF